MMNVSKTTSRTSRNGYIFNVSRPFKFSENLEVFGILEGFKQNNMTISGSLP